jgi:hypothetical protein
MTAQRRLDAFVYGMGVEEPQHACDDCGYTSTNRKNFRRSEEGEGYTCSTGHYTDKSGDLKRQKNPYARPR